MNQKQTHLDDLIARAGSIVDSARLQTPLAGSITNTVTQGFVANAQIACGGSAAMVYMPDEARELAQASDAFYVNVGTLMPILEQSIPAAMQSLNDQRKAWVLDPVAIGIGGLRTRILTDAKEHRPSIIRCNASEAIALSRLWGLDAGNALEHTRGVDAKDTIEAARSSAVSLASYTHGAVAVSGEVDLVTDGTLVAYCAGGSSLMTKVTGSGCALGGVSAVYCGVANGDLFGAALAGTLAFDVAGSRAQTRADVRGPGSFQAAFLDELFHVSSNDIAPDMVKIEAA